MAAIKDKLVEEESGFIFNLMQNGLMSNVSKVMAQQSLNMVLLPENPEGAKPNDPIRHDKGVKWGRSMAQGMHRS